MPAIESRHALAFDRLRDGDDALVFARFGHAARRLTRGTRG